MEVLAARLKWLREQKRLAQKEVASNIGVTLSGYQKIEYGQANPKIETLVNVAKYFKISSDFLLGLVDETEKTIKLLQEVTKYRMKLSQHQEMRSEMREKIFLTEKQIEQLQKTIDINYLTEEQLKMSIKQLETYQDQLAYYDHNYYDILSIMERVIMEYFMEFYSIPFSKPEQNPIIKEYLPLDVALEEYGDRNYKIKLKSLNGTNLGLLYIKQGDDKESNYKDALEHVNKYKALFRLN